MTIDSFQFLMKQCRVYGLRHKEPNWFQHKTKWHWSKSGQWRSPNEGLRLSLLVSPANPELDELAGGGLLGGGGMGLRFRLRFVWDVHASGAEECEGNAFHIGRYIRHLKTCFPDKTVKTRFRYWSEMWSPSLPFIYERNAIDNIGGDK